MQQESIACPIKGCVIELEEVGDEAFSGGMLGEGFAVKPEEGKLYAPVDGIIAAVFRTKHALAMESKDGAEVLIDLGLIQKARWKRLLYESRSWSESKKRRAHL